MQKQTEGKEFKTSIGGQALIEGIMMRAPKKISIVVRTTEGLVEKIDEVSPVKEKFPVLGWVFIRGVVNFVSSMKLGMRSIMYSADKIPEEEIENPSKFDLWLEKKLGNEKAEKVIISIAVVLGIAFSVGLFMLLPTLLAGFATGLIENVILRNLLEVCYALLFSLHISGQRLK